MPAIAQRTSGLPLAIAAYLMWGLLPIYMKLVPVPAFEFVGWRILFTVPVCLAIVAIRRQWRDLAPAVARPTVLAALLASAVLIGGNWLVYILAVQSDHVLAASLGYYINPLINVLLGTVFLRERLSRLQWTAVGIAAVAVALLAAGAREMLWISIALAVSFSLYGLVRKLAPVGALPGLTIETLLLSPPAFGLLLWLAQGQTATHLSDDAGVTALLAFSGVVTAVPLLLFALAARRMDYSALGFVQFLAPTIQFIIGLAVFGETLRPVQAVCFVLIWVAIAVFTWDLVAKRRAASRATKVMPSV